jgi:hypothetical protein
MPSSNSSEMEDQLTMTFQGIMEEVMDRLQAKRSRLPPLLRQHKGQSVVDDTSIVIMKRLISGSGTTTSTMIVCTPPSYFCRYCMWRTLFLSIMHKLHETYSYFCAPALRQLAYSMVKVHLGPVWVLEDWWPTIRYLTLCWEFCIVHHPKRQYRRWKKFLCEL